MPPQATQVSSTATASALAPGWRMWVPCLGMALCSWLSFVDRQVLAILSPTILADTGLTPQDFTNAASFFFLAYTLSNPIWGSILDYVGLRVGMLMAVGIWTAASMSHAWRAAFIGFAIHRGVLLLPRLRAEQSDLGIDSRLRRAARRHADGRRHLDRRQHVACVDERVHRIRHRPRRARIRRRGDVSRRPADGRRIAAGAHA